jgi:hypothetical protein
MQKPSIEVQHAQKSTELTGGLWRTAVLEMGHSVFKRLGTLGRHLATKEGDLGCSKCALRRLDEDPVLLKLVEEGPQMLLVLSERPGEDKDIIQVRKQKLSPRRMSSMEHWNVWAALCRPKGMKGH